MRRARNRDRVNPLSTLSLVKKRLVAHIESNGPMPFDEFMQWCLYDSEAGFFTSGSLRAGTDADFVTSPEVSHWFGRLIGRWASEPAPSRHASLIEIGAGSGSLLEPLIDEIGGWHGPLIAVEVSDAARTMIKSRIPDATVVARVEDLRHPAVAVVVANELLDNLPTRLVERIGQRWVELKVSATNWTLALDRLPCTSNLSDWCDEMLGPVAEGTLMTAQVGVERWIRTLLTSFDAVRICIVDYAGTSEELAKRPRSDVVRTFHRQRSGFDFLEDPGATDITVDVNVDVVSKVVASAGATVSFTDQRSFLVRLGAQEVLAELREREYECARAGDVMGQLVARSDATDARALLDPFGFGGFGVFVISKGT